MTLFKELYDYMGTEDAIWFPVDEMLKITGMECDFLEEVLDLDEKSKILDLGCGRGRHCLELAKRGYDIRGLDISEILITKAREDADEENLEIDFEVGDMREIDYEGEFDVILMMDVTFGLFTDEENEQLVGKINQALKPGGQVFFVLYNPYFWATHPHTRHWGDEDGEVVRRYSFDAETGRVEDLQIYINVKKGTRKVLPIQSLRAYTVPEMRKICKSSGFKTFVLYGDRGDFIPSMEVPFDPEKSLGMYLKIRK